MNYLKFDEARKIVRQLKIKNVREWKKLCKNNKIPANIPKHPDERYCNYGWKGYGEWLGTGRARPSHDYLKYNDAKIIVHSYRLKNFKEWQKFCKSGKKPDNIPSHPERTYKDDGWKWWGEWLGSHTLRQKNFKHFSFMDARLFVRKLKLKNSLEWYDYCKSGEKPLFIPSNPNKKYKNDGWNGYRDWLGTRI